MKNKLAIVADGVRDGVFGGGQNYYHQLCQRMLDSGYDVYYFSYESSFGVLPDRDRFVSLGKQYYSPLNILSINQDVLRLSAQLGEMDFIHTNWWTVIPGLHRISKRYDTRFILECRLSLFNVNRHYNLYKELMLRLFNPDHIMFVENRSLSHYKDKFQRDNYSYVPVPIDINVFQPRPDQKDEDDDFRLLIASRLKKDKGVLDLIQAMELVWQARPNVRLLIAGDGEEEVRIEIENAQKKNPKLVYLGPVENEDMPNIYSQADLFVYPSYYEAFPRAILEAMACGLPCLATEVGGLKILEERNIGRLTQPGNVESLAEAIIELIDDPVKRQQFSENGRDYVLKNHGWSNVLDQTIAIHKTLSN